MGHEIRSSKMDLHWSMVLRSQDIKFNNPNLKSSCPWEEC